jgi:hypothetical protein
LSGSTTIGSLENPAKENLTAEIAKSAEQMTGMDTDKIETSFLCDLCVLCG